ncbi:calpain 7, variant 2 [Chamberlinius hualienensis]
MGNGKFTKLSEGNAEGSDKSRQQRDMERAEFLIYQALDDDEAGNLDEAVELYMQAVELCLAVRKETVDVELQKKLSKLATQALERAEDLKGINKSKEIKSKSSPAQKPWVVPPLGIQPLFQKAEVGSTSLSSSTGGDSSAVGKQLQVSGNNSYTKEELQVIRLTSVINGREYVPWLSVDLRERFAYPLPFSDKDGKLVLSPKQQSQFLKWVRPEEICQNPKMIEIIDYYSIKQTVVSDCSFVASLAISALYEKKFKKRVITRIIYPQSKSGEPVYNPCGKYMIKFNLNGVPRKVIIDDYLPLGVNNELLCSYSTNKNELWISLLEKAYLKVMGGYDFPGSNSNIDLHALIGWIPERVAIRPDDPEFNKDSLFKKLLDRFHKGDVLVTVATGELSDNEASRAGLVPTHAYAMLDVREVRGHRLFLLKNPWSHLRWKGNYSERDKVNWTKELRDELNFDPRSAQNFDNGVFWIDFSSICRYFDVVYMNWNPSLFKYTYCVHQTWEANTGPVKDMYNIGDNPQYSLSLSSVNSAASAVWILLTRHITDREDFAQNKEYITVLVYKNEGKKVYYPYDPAPYIDGTRINSPHYLCKMLLDNSSSLKYTLVVSQYEKTSTIKFTLRVFSTCPFNLTKIQNNYKFKQEVTNGSWKGVTAGGCANHPSTYSNNPVFQIQLNSSTDDNQLLIDLKGPKQFQVGFDVATVSVTNSSATGQFVRKSSGPFRSGFVILDMENIPNGIYNVIPSTFNPGQEGPFFLTVKASCPFKINRIQ